MAPTPARARLGREESGDTTPCKVTPVILRSCVSPGVTLHTEVYPQKEWRSFKKDARVGRSESSRVATSLEPFMVTGLFKGSPGSS